MTEKIRASRLSDDEEEEEDLELLRMVALKSIHLKKDNPPSYHQSPPQSRPQHISAPASYTIPVTQQQPRGHDNGVPATLSPQYYPPAHNLPPQNRILTNPLDNFNNRQRLEQLDINEPYVPQRVPPIAAVGPPPVGTNGWIPEAAVVGSNYAPYIPHKVNDTISLGPNVQLSPRSMAFVAKNNVILARRKGENISPNYAYRSPSPLYRHTSPGRWSKSPSPQLKSNSRSPVHRNRPHQYNHRRSISRSPPPNRPRSPPFRRRSMTRSPPLMQQVSRHQSPNPFHSYPSRSPPPQNRRAKSRSPIGPKHKLSPRRHISRSPPLQPSSRNGGRPLSRSPPASFNGRRRSPLLGPRHGNKNRRTPSPHNMKRSPGNMFYDSCDIGQRHPNRGRSPQQMPVHRRSASPVSLPPRQRSHSRSPPRKYQRRSRDRAVNINNQAGNRRRSPYMNGRRRYDGPQNGFRNRGRKRSLSPSKDRLKKSRSKSADRNRRNGGKRSRRPEHDNRKADEIQRNELKPSNNDKIVKKSQINDVIKDDEEKNRPLSSTPPPVTVAEETSRPQIVEQPATAMNDPKSEDKRQNSDPSNVKADKDSSDNDEDDDEDDDDDDGIDLFASEESESENEGRFKSSTSKNERDTQAPTLSFTKLGETVPVAVKELNDLPNTTSNRGGQNDRNRSRNNYGRSRGDHFRSMENSRNSRNDRRSKNTSKNNRRDRDRNRDWDGGSSSNSKSDEKKNDDKPMFKATFQAVEGEGRSSRKNSRERDLTDRKSSNSNKRRNTSKDRKVSPETEMNIDQLPSAITLVTSSSLSTSSTATTTKSSSSPSRSVSDSTSSSSGGGGGGGAKKPIHLRLGAMTNTFKPPKKPLTWNSSTSSEKV